MAVTLTPAQIALLATELTTDPQGLGYAPYIAAANLPPLLRVLAWVRDGATPQPDNGIIGRSGAITGATNASPIVLTSTGHGLSSSDSVVVSGVGGNTAANSIPINPAGLPLSGAVVPNPSWGITKINNNSFSLTGSTGNAAYTSGGTWAWCVASLANGNKIFNKSVSVASVIANVLPADAAAAAALTGAQAIIMPAFLNPQGSVPLTDSDGNELNTVAWLNLLTASGSTSRKAVKALETRFGSRVEQVLSLPGYQPTQDDVDAALGR